MKSKYVITDEQAIIVFPRLTPHSQFSGYNPVSAGFIGLKKDGNHVYYECSGESESLGIESRPEMDSQIANIQLLGGLHGQVL